VVYIDHADGIRWKPARSQPASLALYWDVGRTLITGDYTWKYHLSRVWIGHLFTLNQFVEHPLLFMSAEQAKIRIALPYVRRRIFFQGVSV